MQKIRSCFLFRTGCSTHKGLFWLWNWFFILTSGAVTGLFSLLLAYGTYPRDIFFGYFEQPIIAALNIFPVMLLIVLLYCLIGRAWIAFAAVSVPVFLASAGNFFKLLFRDDPFIFADVTVIGTALKVSGQYDIVFNYRLKLFAAFIVLAALFLAFLVRGRIRRRNRLIAAAALAISLVPLSRVYLSEYIHNFKALNYEHANQWSATQSYISRGFIYPFIYSIPEAFPRKAGGLFRRGGKGHPLLLRIPKHSRGQKGKHNKHTAGSLQ